MKKRFSEEQIIALLLAYAGASAKRGAPDFDAPRTIGNARLHRYLGEPGGVIDE
ncbi:hypothetical protein [Luteibacter yeojuensis]|uniref:Uncharacterized protein n=1 Tax=Luteibacter yeojuensis TaxID=345309 RepID=A0A7X5QRR0_9GAMM|nr:hypothetical protein [Luteibacter yeojuensis]NID14196.1 hypothetical protein [Luteibacter yeojuensis]